MDAAVVLQYGSSPRQIVKLYPSKKKADDGNASSSSLLIFVHGGAWRDGSINDHQDLAVYISNNANVTVALIEYRLTLPENSIRHPDHINDFHQGLEAIWDPLTASKHSYDCRNAILVGHSVGGWMVLSAALASENVNDDDTSVSNIPPLRGDIRKELRAFVAVESIFSIVGLARHYPSYSSFIVSAFYTQEEATLAKAPYTALTKAGVESWPVADSGSYLDGNEPKIYIIHSSEDDLLDSDYNQEGIVLLQQKGLHLDIDLKSFKGKHDDVLHHESIWQRLIDILVDAE